MCCLGFACIGVLTPPPCRGITEDCGAKDFTFVPSFDIDCGKTLIRNFNEFLKICREPAKHSNLRAAGVWGSTQWKGISY